MYVYINMYVCMYVCIYVYIYIYIYTYDFRQARCGRAAEMAAAPAEPV